MKPDLLAVIGAARRRWRLRVLLHGLAWVAAGGLVAVLIGAWGVDYFRFSPAAVTVFRVLVWGTVAGLFAWRVLRPLARRITDEQVALYLEEHESSLDGTVLGAMAGQTAATDISPALMDRIVARAVERLESVDRGRRIERPTLQRSSGVLAAVAVVSIGAWLLGPGSVRTGLPFVVAPFRDAGGSPYAIEVLPGDSTTARGADVRVRALLRNFTAEDVTLVLRPRSAQEWERVSMQLGEDGDGLEYLLFDIRDTTEYFVTAGGVRSAVYRLAVVDLPYVEAISLLYTFPAYTGLEPVRQDDGGDIAALVGTRVRVEVTPTITAAGGALVVGTDTLALEPGDGSLTGDIEVRESGSYRVLLAGPDGRLVPASPEYFIDALDDQPPMVRISEPGRDVSVTSVDELFAEVRAEDDFGLRRVELIYAVNGGAEVTRELYGGQGLRKDVTAGHTLYLEEMSLQPGDVVAYYARAADARRDGEPAATDIYFVTIRPFDRRWRAAEERGQMPGQQGGGVSPGELSNRQRDIIAATFRLVRDSARFGAREWLDNLGTVTLMQGRLREEVETLVRRFETRGVAEMDTTLATVAQALPLAAEAMSVAEDRLGRRLADSALSPEQRALQQLQRAEAAFRERQVQLGQQQGGGGGGGGASAEELADLFDLEMDRLRNQYESVERGQRQQMEQQADEALEKLRELARRQQQENERRRAQAAGDANGDGQRRLADEAEELGRRLERLAREQNNAELSEAARRLQDAANAMRRAAAGQRGTAQGEAAAEQLREARRRLEQSRGAAQERDLQDALRRAERLVQEQDEVRERLRDLPTDSAGRQSGLRQLSERKNAMAEEVDQLESELDRLARDTHGEQPEASERLRATVKETRDKRLQDKIRYSRGVMAERSSEYAEAFEESIAGDLEALRDGIAQAAERMGEADGQRRERALDRARDVARALESLGERAREGAGAGADSGRGGLAPADRERQLRGEMRRRAEELRELGQELGRDGMDARPLEDIARRLGRMDASGEVGTPRGLEQLADAIQALKDFEFALRRELMGDSAAPPVLTAGEDVPPAYRAMVEEYYRRLAERRR